MYIADTIPYNQRAHHAATARRCIGPAVFAMLLALLWVVPCHAQLIQGAHVLDLMARALAGGDTLRVEQWVVIDEGEVADEPSTLNETLYFAFPGRFRSDVSHGETHRIHVVSQERTSTFLDGRRSADPFGPYHRYTELLRLRSRHALHKMLLTEGVDVEMVSLGRFEGHIAYVLGARYPDESVAQLWVDRERFLPLRWLLITGSDNMDRLEFVYRNWERYNGQWYPGRIHTYYRSHPIRRIDVRHVASNIALPEDLFDIDHLTARFPPAEPEAPPIDAPEAPLKDEVQRLLEEALQDDRPQ